MIRKITFSIILMLTIVVTACAESIFEGLEYTARIGYSIGGATPMGMPATIRSLNKYKLRADFDLGVDVQKHFTEQWGVLTGLHVENKAMTIDATVKNYHMAMVQGDDEIEGYYTGNLVTKYNEWMFTLPLMATFNINDKVMLKCGPYISYIIGRTFKGHVYNGYLRETDPTGTKIEIDNSEDTVYDFSDKMRRFHVGMDLGVDWRIGNRLGAYADLKWGLNGIHKSSFKTIEQTLYPIYGTLGVIYRIK